MRFLVIALLAAVAPWGFGLDADNLLLVTNKNVPEGRKLAEFYAAARNVPDHRIIELDLPDADEVPFDLYESRVIPAIREFLVHGDLQNKVTCLVTFYGVPLRIAPRVNKPADLTELAELKRDRELTLKDIRTIVKGTEEITHELDPKFAGGSDDSLPGLAARDNAARALLAKLALQVSDPEAFQKLMDRTDALLSPLVGVAPAMQRRLQALAPLAGRWSAAQRQEVQTLREKLLKMRSEFDDLQAHRASAQSRSQLRALVKEQLGLMEYARLLEGMIEYFSTEATGSAFDSELALVNWNLYVREKWLPNPLQFKTPRPDLPPILMTFRLDAPQPQLVRTIITDSIKTESTGLSGEVVIDAGGHLAIDSNNASYRDFDHTLAHLAELVRTKTKLHMTLDEKRDILPAQSVDKPIAVYCGWYALQNYTPPGKFVAGSVAYHVASFELTTLHNPQARQWGRGLLNDGVASTLGAVNEPFLSAFPAPDEFFPLLFTGQLSLAEVYWKTTPMVSWQIAMVGDPLYRPFMAHPALKMSDLSAELRAALKPAPRVSGGGPH